MSLFEELFTEQKGEDGPSPDMPGIVYGVVKENWDKEHPGMVKVEILQGEKEKNITEWIPVMTAYGGAEFGLYALPEIGSQAVVAFELGNVQSPLVIGCVWNQKDPPPPNRVNEKNTEKVWITKGGNCIRFVDEENKEKLELTTKGGLFLGLDDENQVLSLRDEKAGNQIQIDSRQGTITIAAEKKVIFQAGQGDMLTLDGEKGQAAVKGKQVSLEGEQRLQLKGQTAHLEGNTLQVKGQDTKLEGQMLSISGKGTVKAESSGILQLKGSMVKIN